MTITTSDAAALAYVIESATRHTKAAGERLSHIREEITDRLQDGGNLGAADFSSVIRTQITSQLWNRVASGIERGVSLVDALRVVRTETEQKIRNGSFMSSTDPMENAVRLIERETRIAWSDQIEVLLTALKD